MKYLALYVALYDYQAQSVEEELSFKADDVLYILDMDDPNWYKAQLKVPQADGPTGLIPSNYIVKAKPIGSVKALYDYSPRSVEEMELKEDEQLALYEDDDPNWYFVENTKGQFGLAPSNYVERLDNEEEALAPAPAPAPINNATDTTTATAATQQQGTSAPAVAMNKNDPALSWPVFEFDSKRQKRTKDRGNLLIGNGMICYGSETNKTSPVRQFPVNQIRDATFEGKNVHIGIDDSAKTVFDFQTSTHSEAKAIIEKIRSSKAAFKDMIHQRQQKELPALTNLNNPQLPGTNTAAAVNDIPETLPKQPTLAPGVQPKWAIALYAFKAEIDEETYLHENEQVLVTDYAQNSDWWTIEHKDGTSGIVPATYVKFQDEYEAELFAENENLAKKQAGERTTDEETEKQQQQQQLADMKKQAEIEEKTRKEDETKRLPASVASPMANSAQIVNGSPKRSQIPAPPPPNQTGRLADNQPARQSPQMDSGKPDTSKIRIWTDRTGAFKVEAQFLLCANGKIRLHKTNGVKIDVPMNKMCIEDLRFIEKETGLHLVEEEDKNDTVPLSNLQQQDQHRTSFNWLAYFKKINLPNDACNIYARTFEANGLTDRDIDNLTYRKLKALGMTERHLRRFQRYVETNQAEPLSEDEGDKPKQKVKKNVTFGGVTYIDDIYDDEYYDEQEKQRQIQQDEMFARQLQEEEAKNTGFNNTGLHRRGTGRPTPAHSAPKDVDVTIFGNQQPPPSQPFNSNTPSARQLPSQSNNYIQPTPASLNASTTQPTTSGFSDDAWAPRASNSPSIQQRASNFMNNSFNSSPSIPSASNTLPAGRQRPVPQLSQASSVDPGLLAKWKNDEALVAANRRPVPPPPPSVNQPPSVLQQSNSFSSNPSVNSPYQGTSNTAAGPPPPPPFRNGFATAPAVGGGNAFQIHQHTGGNNNSAPSIPNLPSSADHSSPLLHRTNTGTGLNSHSMYNQAHLLRSMSTPLQHQQQSQGLPPLVPQPTGVAINNNNNYGINTPPSYQQQPSLPVATNTTGGRSWVNATPDNPFGTGAFSNPAMTMGQPPIAGQISHNNQMTSTPPIDKYSVFRSLNTTSSPNIFNNQQQQQQPSRSFY